MTHPSPILFFSYARTGGTLMNKCLLNLPNTIVLSEINPNEFGEGLWKNRPHIDQIVQLQLKKWYGITIHSTTFDEAVLELINYCSKNNLRLIIRDFSIADFVSSPLLDNQPKNKLSWLAWMKKHQIKHQNFSLIRHPLHVWISQQMPPLDIFIPGYANFLSEIKTNNIPNFHYELFTSQPVSILDQILKLLQINYKASELLNIENKSNLFGDLKRNSNHQQLSQIRVLAEKPIPFWNWYKARKKMKNEAIFTEFFEFQDSKKIDELMYNTFIFYWSKLKKI